MRHVVAFDVSIGKSTMAIYNRYRKCESEGEIKHTYSAFEVLNETLQSLMVQYGQATEIVFEATGVYSKALERFSQKEEYAYGRINRLEANLQMASMRRQKTDKSGAHELAKSHSRLEREKTIRKMTITIKCMP